MFSVRRVVLVVNVVVDYKSNVFNGVTAYKYNAVVRATKDTAEVTVCLNRGVLYGTVGDIQRYCITADTANLIAVIVICVAASCIT